tara:strand:+ start:2617 stop:3513 length:897 start_codon:yes stop_codon:yes gene_type:complete
MTSSPNNANPLVSVIINCFNGEKYLKSCIDSVINQTYKNWEIIFWDNLSTDDSKKIIHKYSDKRIKYFCTEKFSKLYQARNLAIEKASGTLIAFLDVDDFWFKDKLDKQIQKIKEENTNIVYSNFFTFYENSNKKKIFSKKILPKGQITQKLFNNYRVGILTLLIKKDLLINRKFKNEYDVIGDFDLITDISRKFEFTSIQEPLAIYRIHKDNVSLERIKKEKEELDSWITNNKSKYKSYSLDGVYEQIKFLSVKIDLISGNKVNAIKKILILKNSLRKIKFLISCFLPNKILKILIS